MANSKEGYKRLEVQVLDKQQERLKNQAKEKGLRLSEYIRTILSSYMNKTRDF